MKNPILIRKAVELKPVLVLSITNVICTMLILSHVPAYIALSIWEYLMSEEVTNNYNFCHSLQLNFMFYYVQVAFLIYLFLQ